MRQAVVDVHEPHWWRGFIWQWDSDHQAMAASALLQLQETVAGSDYTITIRASPVLCPVHLFSKSLRAGAPVATSRWRDAINEILAEGSYQSVDGIPWEIHAIEDEDAWLAAIE